MDEDALIAAFSHKLKTLRLSNGLTLEELGEMSGVSISTISKIENRQQKPSFETVLRVARALRINFMQMLETTGTPNHLARRTITRAGDAQNYSAEQYLFEAHATELSHKAMVPTLIRILNREVPPPDQWSTQGGEDFFYVLDGVLEFHSEEYVPAILNKGDSCYFDSTMRHTFVSKSIDDASILSVCSPIQKLNGKPTP